MVAEHDLIRVSHIIKPWLSRFGRVNYHGLATHFRPTQGSYFSEHDLYRPGDDARAIDWRASARHPCLIKKLYTDDYYITWHIFIDDSASMAYPEKQKWLLVRQLVLGFCYCICLSGFVVQISSFSGKRLVPTQRGITAYEQCARFIQSLTPVQGNVLHLPIASNKKVIVFIFSDFLIQNLEDRLLRPLYGLCVPSKNSKMHAIQVLNLDEMPENLPNNSWLTDIESGECLPIESASKARKIARKNLDQHNRHLQHLCRLYQINFSSGTSHDTWPQLLINHLSLPA